MELQQIRYFLAVCETLNFSRAAQVCNVTQPSLTRAIQDLEEELGGELIRRERANTHLTELGRLVKHHLENAYDELQMTRAQAAAYRGLVDTPLTVGVMCTIAPLILVPLLGKLQTETPGISVRLTEDTGAALINRLLSGDLDIALLGMPEYSERLSCERLYSERFVVAFPKGHQFEDATGIPLASVAAEDLLWRESCEYGEFFQEYFRSQRASLNVVFESRHDDWIQAMVAAGAGCALLPEFTTLTPGVVSRPIVDPIVARDISLVTVRGRRHSAPVAAAVRLIISHAWSLLNNPL